MSTPTNGSARPLTQHQRAVLEALTLALVPRLQQDAQLAARVTASIASRIESAPAPVRADLERAIGALGSPAISLLVAGSARPLHRLRDAVKRTVVLRRWSTTWLAAGRSAFHALRRLVLSTWYASADARRELGLLPPLHQRAAVIAWEGPLRGTPSDAEPVVRWQVPRDRVPGSNPQRRPLPEGVIDTRKLQADCTVRADAVVVGSGAGGSVVAARLAEAGREVIILEEGDYMQAYHFDEDEQALTPRLFADRALRATTDASVVLLQGCAAGGGTVVNWMLMLRTPPEVLEEWRREHGLSWLSEGVMEPVFERIEQEVHARLVPEDAHSPSNALLLRGAQALGWQAREAAINAKGCVRAGTCSLGCRYEAKQSALLTYLPRAFAQGARLFPGTSVHRVEVVASNASGGVATKRVHAWVHRPDGRPARLVAEAPVVVLAAGAVGTPAILERSGLGGGGVGRYLRLHPTTAVLGTYDCDVYPLAGIPQSAICDHFLRRDRYGHGFWIECPALQPGLAAAALGSFGEEHWDAMRRLRQSAAFIVLVRDGSGRNNSQGAVWLDRRGRVRVSYRLTPLDLDNLKTGVEAAARLHLAAGAREVLTLHTPAVRVHDETDLHSVRTASYRPNRVTLFSAHVNGTCRMGVRPTNSGTDPHGQRHGVPGLYVADGSLLPSAPGVNPQETIMALASFVAERIIERG